MSLFDRLRGKFKTSGAAPRAPTRPAGPTGSAPSADGLKVVTAADADRSEIVERVLGRKLGACITGVEPRRGKEPVYLVTEVETERVYRVIEIGEHWQVLLMEERGGHGVAGGKIEAIWTTQPNETTDAARATIRAFLGDRNLSDLLFVCSKVELATEVERKTFVSEIGRITVHSRRVPEGTEGCIQLHDSGECVSFLWERALGGARETGRTREPTF